MRAVLAGLARWPLWGIHALGGALGLLALLFAGATRRRLVDNATQAGLTPPQCRRALRESGRLLLEAPWVWLRPDDRPLAPLVRWADDTVVAQALAAGRGVIFLTPHLGSFEVAGRMVAERVAAHGGLTVLYRPARQPWLADIEQQARAREAMATVPASVAGVRQMLRALRRGESVGLLPDQVPPAGQGVWAPFFGRPAYTMTLAARLAQQTGATLVAVWCQRLPRGRGFVMHARPLPLPQGDDDTPDESLAVEQATAINVAMEAMIRQCPEQYLWSYHRYKNPREAGV